MTFFDVVAGPAADVGVPLVSTGVEPASEPPMACAWATPAIADVSRNPASAAPRRLSLWRSDWLIGPTPAAT